MMTRHKQRGMTMIGWLVLLVFIGVIALVSLKLIPAYMEFYTILQSVESVHAQATPQMSAREVQSALAKRFNVNNVESLDAKDLKVTRVDGRLIIRVAYEVRKPMMGNVDAVVKFDREVR